MTVDVVITTREGWALTRQCLAHLEAQTLAHRVIVSDSGSTDGTPTNIRALFPHVALLAHDGDPGYTAATNEAVALSEADLVVLLNNDAFCRPNFLEKLAEMFDSDERVGSVAPLTV